MTVGGPLSMNLKATLLGGWLGDRLLRDVQVDDIQKLGPSFRRIRVSASWLRESGPSPGDKVQVFIPEVGTRTYTPFDFEKDAGGFSVLAYIHGETPGSRWARTLGVGSKVRFFGPSQSISLASVTGPVALFGDETSIGVARCLQALQPERVGSVVRLEVSSVESSSEACAVLGVARASLIAKREGDEHLPEIAQGLAAATAQGGSLVLTGRARSIQKLRALLLASSHGGRQKVKAYWAEGKCGLD